MYLEHFGLTESPFSTVPDPRFYYPSVKHREALACLVYAIENHKGVALVTGDIGTGKTMLCQAVLKQIEGETDVALLDYTLLAPDEFHKAVCESFDLSPDGSKFELRQRLGQYAEEQKTRGSDVVLIVDEAQNLSQEVLEELRTLSNLATPTHKLLQIILLGQPEFRSRINAPGMEALDQRITLKFHLGPLSLEDTRAYIGHRLEKAGAEDDSIFEDEAAEAVHDATGGVPRLVNVLCDQALLMAYSNDETTVTAETVKQTVEDRDGFYCEDEPEIASLAQEADVAEAPQGAGSADADEWKKRCERLKRETKSLEKRLAEERQRADRLGERVETLQEKIENYADSLEEAQAARRDQQDIIAKREREIEALEQKLQSATKGGANQKKLREKLNSLQEKVAGYLERIDELQEQKHEQAETLASLEQEVADLERQRAEDGDHRADYEALQKKANSLEKEVRKRRRVQEETADHLFSAGEAALDAGHSKAAAAMLQGGVDLGLDTPLALYRLGSALFQNEQYEAAIGKYRAAISRLESDPDRDHTLLLKAYNNCGVALARLGRFEEALAMYRKAVGRGEDYASPYLNIGILCRDELGDEDAALEAFRKYVELNGRRKDNVRRAIEELKSGQATAH